MMRNAVSTDVAACILAIERTEEQASVHNVWSFPPLPDLIGVISTYTVSSFWEAHTLQT